MQQIDQLICGGFTVLASGKNCFSESRVLLGEIAGHFLGAGKNFFRMAGSLEVTKSFRSD
jgi:hypothetical protein